MCIFDATLSSWSVRRRGNVSSWLISKVDYFHCCFSVSVRITHTVKDIYGLASKSRVPALGLEAATAARGD